MIGVPIPTPNLGGLDSLLSIVPMPRGIPVATVGIGSAELAALLAVSILALSNAGLAAGLEAYRVAQTDAILGDPSNAERLGWDPPRRSPTSGLASKVPGRRRLSWPAGVGIAPQSGRCVRRGAPRPQR